LPLPKCAAQEQTGREEGLLERSLVPKSLRKMAKHILVVCMKCIEAARATEAVLRGPHLAHVSSYPWHKKMQHPANKHEPQLKSVGYNKKRFTFRSPQCMSQQQNPLETEKQRREEIARIILKKMGS